MFLEEKYTHPTPNMFLYYSVHLFHFQPDIYISFILKFIDAWPTQATAFTLPGSEIKDWNIGIIL